MKRHIKSAITRLRKAQDKVFNHKEGDCYAIDISAHNDDTVVFYSIYCLVGPLCQSFYISPKDSEESVNGILDDVSKFVGFEV
jgi:hypothetical protein